MLSHNDTTTYPNKTCPVATRNETVRATSLRLCVCECEPTELSQSSSRRRTGEHAAHTRTNIHTHKGRRTQGNQMRTGGVAPFVCCSRSIRLKVLTRRVCDPRAETRDAGDFCYIRDRQTVIYECVYSTACV